jgi:NifB/MoaA-like Fe-S oxidoreductase
VLCPGINDGKDLEETLLKLISGFKNILSIGIVPVGITRFNKNPELKPFTKENALKIINKINDFKKKHGSLKKSVNIFLSDEFYVLAGIDFPEYKYYGDFYQIENGIGKSTVFLKEINEQIKIDNLADKSGSGRGPILIVTSEYGGKVINESLNIILKKLKTAGKKIVSCVKVLEVKNKFLGGNVKVTGLLSGQHINAALGEENTEGFDKILVPDGIFNEDNLTIDDFNKKDIEEISSRIKIISEDGYSFIREIIFN